jgi:hypothetical protein
MKAETLVAKIDDLKARLAKVYTTKKEDDAAVSNDMAAQAAKLHKVLKADGCPGATITAGVSFAGGEKTANIRLYTSESPKSLEKFIPIEIKANGKFGISGSVRITPEMDPAKMANEIAYGNLMMNFINWADTNLDGVVAVLQNWAPVVRRVIEDEWTLQKELLAAEKALAKK